MTGAVPFRRRSALACAAATALSLFAQAAWADQTFVLATSKLHKLQVLAEGGADWCKANLRLHLVMEAGSPDAGNTDAQVAIMNRLGVAFESECKAAVAAELTVSGPGGAVGIYAATASSGWHFDLVGSPSRNQAAPDRAQRQAQSAPAAPPPGPNAASSTTPSSSPTGLPRDTQAPPARTAAAASAPASVQATAPQQAAVPAANDVPTLPRERDYASVLLAYVQGAAGLVDDDTIQMIWAGYRYPQQLRQVWNQDFKLRALLDDAKNDLVRTMGTNDAKFVTLVVTTGFDNYDFKANRYPLVLRFNMLTVRSNLWAARVAPPPFNVDISDLDMLTGVPMDQETARNFEEKRTRFGQVDRQVVVALRVRLTHPFTKDNWGTLKAEGTLDSAIIFADQDGKQPIYQLTSAELGTLRAARDAERQAEARRKEEAAKVEAERLVQQQRQQWIAQLAGMPPESRLANWISDGQLNFSARLDDLYTARMAALVEGKPVPVAMLVQTDGSGHQQVATTWPGHLEVTDAADQPTFARSGWYLVRGTLNVPEAEGLPAAKLAASKVYACSQPECADAMDAATIVKRKTATPGNVQ
jgi:hypothetical protein